MTQAESEQLQRGAAVWGVKLDEAALDRFARFAEMLAETNQHLNLTRVPAEEWVTRHFLDSLTIFAVGEMRASDVQTLLDVGTGAGFPGIPLAIARPDWHITLLDGTRKRLLFLDQVIAALELPHVATLHARAEQLASPQIHPTRYDAVVSRAVAPLPKLAQWCLPLAKSSGLVVACKSLDVAAELQEARPVIARLGGTVEFTQSVPIPETDIRRTLIGIRRKAVSPAAPRRPRR
jgi:16S rRNA (guanine527-N7)-methyltransferase